MEKVTFEIGPIEALSWGEFVIRGQVHGKSPDGSVCGVGKDIFLVGEEIHPWSERKGHLLSEEMVRRVLDYGVDILIIGTGILGAIQVPAQVRQFLRNKGVTAVMIQKTPEACLTFNRLYREGKKVALLAHGTC